MFITNSDEIIPVLRSRLNDYLISKDIKEPHQKKFPCIVHDDSTPSMALNPKTNFETAHCFGCGATVDIFKAASILEGLPETGSEWMTNTVPSLAEQLNIPVRFGEPNLQDRERLKFFKLAQDIADILESEHHINKEYTEQRHWENSLETCGTISEDELIAHLIEKGWNPTDITTSLMVRTATTSFFGEDKVTFTIRDARGRPCGFISRNLGTTGPKYLNTAENCIFEKRKTLLGLDKAIKPARYHGLYIVEGPGDRAQLLRLGIENVAATMGTAFTPEHVALLRMHGIKDVYFCLDWDDAGTIATNKIFEEVLRAAPGISCWVVEPPGNMGKNTDPDSYLFNSFNRSDFESLTKTTAFEWVMKNTSENDSPADVCAKMVPLIAAESTAIGREILIKQLQEFTGVSWQAISSDVSSIRDRKHEERTQRLLAAADKYRLEVEKDPNNLLASLSQHEADIDHIEKDYEKDIIGTQYQLSRLDALETLKEPTEDGVDRTVFRMNYFKPVMEAFSGGMIMTTGTVIYLGGRANSGKTATGTALAIDVALSDPDTIVIGHFTDDALALIQPRLLTIISKMIEGPQMQSLTIGMAANPHANIHTSHHAAMYKNATMKLRDLLSEEKLILIDSEDGATLSTLERYLRHVRRRYPDKKILMFCDNTYNYMDYGWLDKTERITQIANTQKNLTIKYRACMLATAEYRKNQPLDQSKLKLPVNDDLADSRAMMYRSNAIIHVYNDLKDRGDAAEFYWVDPAKPDEPQARLLLVFGKNKITGFDKTLYLDLDKDTVTLRPVSVETAKADIISGNNGTRIVGGRVVIAADEYDED